MSSTTTSNNSSKNNNNKKNMFKVTYTGPILKMHGEFVQQLREVARQRSGGRPIPGDADCCSFKKQNFIYIHRNSRKDIPAEELERNKRQVVEFHEAENGKLLDQDAKQCHRRGEADDAHFLKALVTAAVNFQKSHDHFHSNHHAAAAAGSSKLPSYPSESESLAPLPENFATRILRSADAAARVHHQSRTVTAKKAEDYDFVLNALIADVDSFVPALGHRKTLEALSKLDLWKVVN